MSSICWWNYTLIHWHLQKERTRKHSAFVLTKLYTASIITVCSERWTCSTTPRRNRRQHFGASWFHRQSDLTCIATGKHQLRSTHMWHCGFLFFVLEGRHRGFQQLVHLVLRFELLIYPSIGHFLALSSTHHLSQEIIGHTQQWAPTNLKSVA